MKLDSCGNILLGPIISEKASIAQQSGNSIAFWVSPRATKLQIKNAVESLFANIKVESVTTSVLRRAFTSFGQIEGRTKKKKKAYVKLAGGQEINFAELG